MKRAKNVVLYITTFLNAFSLVFWLSALDVIVSWQPYMIMAVNTAWLFLFCCANQK